MKKLNLARYQQSFVSSVREENKNFEYLENIIPIGDFTATKVMGIYRMDYRSRLQEALGENFESIWAVIGDEDFFSLAQEYILKFPSSKKNLNEYGDQMPLFLKEHPLSQDFPFLIDLALFEIEFWKMFHKEAQTSLFDLTQFTEDKLLNSKVKFIDNFKVFNWNHKLYDIWKERQNGLSGKDQTDFENEQYIALFKSSPQIKVEVFDQKQALILDLLIKELPIFKAIEESGIESAEQIQKLFGFLSSSGVISKLY